MFSEAVLCQNKTIDNLDMFYNLVNLSFILMDVFMTSIYNIFLPNDAEFERVINCYYTLHFCQTCDKHFVILMQ